MSSRVLRLPSITTRKPQIPAPSAVTTTIHTDNTNNNKKKKKTDEYPLFDKIGQRVSIPSMELTGTLRYVGQPEFKKGVWAGIELSDAQGKNDGSVQGVKYFSCPPDCGIFIGVGKIVLLPPSPTTSSLPPKPSTSTRRSNLPLIPHASSSSSNSSNNSKASKTMLKRPGSRTPASSSTTLTKKPSKTLTHKPSRTFTKRSHHLRVSSVPSESTPSPTATPPPPANTTSPTKSLKTSPSPVTKSVRSSYTTTPPPVSPPIQYEEEIQLLKKQLDDAHDELDKMKREKDTMLVQMKGKETAWERLVSSKESLSLQVEEKHEQHQRTQRELDQLAQHVEKLEADLAERDASIAKNIRNDEKQTQDQRRIERLESLVRELQQQIQNDAESHAQAQREHAGILDQVRREVSTGETMSAALEKECADLRRAGLEAMAAYEQSVLQINQQHLSQLHDKDEQMRQLQTVISELKRNILFDDEEMDIDAILKSSDASDQRHRLEEQLELTMAELDHERLIIKSQLNEMEQLKAEAVQLRAQKSSLEERYMALQTDLERELHDKKRLIEEADAAFEAQAKAEDEHYQMKLEKMAIEKELTLYKDDLIDKEKHELVQINKQLEQDCIKLMDDMLALEKQVEQGEWQSRVASLEKENLEQRKSLTQLELEKRTQVNQLSQDLAELESLVENKVLEEGDLEEQLDKERRKVVELERALKKYTLSPNTTTDDEVDDVKELYCENCEDFGLHTTDDCPNQDETF